MMNSIIYRKIALIGVVRRNALVLLLAVLPLGCNDESGLNSIKLSLYPVKGQVLLQDGKPLTSGLVEFVLTNGPAIASTGEIGTDGSYTLQTEGKGPGAPAGEYKVRIIPAEASYSTRSRRQSTAKSIDLKKLGFNAKFLDDEESKLTAVVKAQDNQIEPFRLTR